ncbi:hypothetical protein [Pedobacter jamesrossensis]|uniref:Uncharacterized protein n=1 Tax=Pedobacter jamesrossensis TaxID=1908238 RepID=A0ABV8NLY1_9SPHI
MFDEYGKPQGIFCLGYNITDFIADKRLLEGAKTEIERNAELLRTIAFQQSHLIRAPLTNIIALATILQKYKHIEGISTLCEMVLESATKLDLTIKNIVGDIHERNSNP